MNWRQVVLFVCGLVFSLALSLGINHFNFGVDQLWAQGITEPESGLDPELSSPPTLPTSAHAFTSANLNQNNIHAEIIEIKSDPTNLSHLLRHAQIWRNQGLYRDEIYFWRSTLDGLNPAAQSIAHAHMAMAFNELGEWQTANEQIQTSLQLINDPDVVKEIKRSELAIARSQILNTQGTLQLAQGKPEVAMETWKESEALYRSANDQLGIAITTINQAKALQTMGLYRRASNRLNQVKEFADADLAQFADQSLPELTEAAIFDHSGTVRVNLLLSLADGYRVVGNLDAAQQVLEQVLAKEAFINPYGGASSPDWQEVILGLGHIAQTQGELDKAKSLYDQLANTSHCYISVGEDLRDRYERDAPELVRPTKQACLIGIKAILEQATIATQIGTDVEAIAWLNKIYNPVQALPATRTAIFTKVRWSSQTIALLKQNSTIIKPELLTKTNNLLAQTLTQAQQLNDPKAIAYVLGTQAHLDEIQGNYARAIATTQTALNLAQASQANEIVYQWEWQLGRLYHQTRNNDRAIAAYRDAVNTLQKLRHDLVAISDNTKFSFRDQVEPVYRELVDLLIPHDPDNLAANHSPHKPKLQIDKTAQTQANLRQARQVIEQLQIAELDNFFRQACLDAEFSSVEMIDPQAAIVYPIITPSRLEVIVSIPDRPLFHYGTKATPMEVKQSIDQILDSLRQNSFASERLPIAQQFYDWLIRPAQAELAAAKMQTLVMVLDGELRNVPMAALYDRDTKQYLIEKYNLVLNQGLKLLKGRSALAGENLRVVTAGISEAQAGFIGLPAVDYELAQIAMQFRSRSLLNQGFTANSLEMAIANSDYPIIHLATHGQFSSNLKDTFILAWDDKINIDRLEKLLSPRQNSDRTPIELLVLSACETATGDRRAALGLAGVALRSGARSTLASLWTVADRSTAELMVRFYEGLGQPDTTKATALRQAQLSLLRGEQGNTYRHPYYWAAFVLAGNWL
ncbi:TPR repeat-containing protein (plasmid) [Thalassoporum mexicanum PCC 7367]|nr:TPR repeat-containing protein [Pseudanabaena sp. PCC 7367]